MKQLKQEFVNWKNKLQKIIHITFKKLANSINIIKAIVKRLND